MKGLSLLAALVALQVAFAVSVSRAPSAEQAAARLAASAERAAAAVSARAETQASASRAGRAMPVLASR